MSFWVILSWIFVFILTAINIFVFLKLKGASEQMMKMMFPGAKNMNEAMGQMQGMLSGMGGMGGRGGMPRGPQGNSQQMNQQLKMAMDMLQKMKK
jgi:nitrate/nitrite transporter NarK